MKWKIILLVLSVAATNMFLLRRNYQEAARITTNQAGSKKLNK